jgi:Protein of unknown function (DUF2530)
VTGTPAPPPSEHPREESAEPPRSEHHFLVQAPVAPVDVDGFNVVVTGTVTFAVASIVCAIRYDDLAARGDGWWLGVCISGFLLGLVGLLYCWNRRRRRRAGLWTKD